MPSWLTLIKSLNRHYLEFIESVCSSQGRGSLTGGNLQDAMPPNFMGKKVNTDILRKNVHDNKLVKK